MGGGLDFTVIADNWLYFLVGGYPNGPIGGLALTIYLAVVSCVLSFFGGLVLGLLSLTHRRWLALPVNAFIQTVRGVPLLMVVFWMYFVLPNLLGGPIPESQTVIAALTLFTSAYMSQIVRAGIHAVPRGQTEAAISTGLSPRQAMYFVVLPQALRHMIPSFVNQLVSLIKDTSLAFIVGVSELTHVATQISNRTMIYPTEIFLFIGAVYFVLCYFLTSTSRRLEKQLALRVAA